MNKSSKQMKWGLLSLLFTMALTSLQVNPTPLALETAPLFTTSAVDPNLILTIDDSGSMDSEVLFPTNDGALWWDTANDTFVSSGAVNFNISGSADSSWKKFTYLFPNGTGTGKRVYSDSTHNHYAIPPLPQFAFARSSVYNKMYYNPDETYQPWVGGGTASFGQIDETAAPTDPQSNTGTTLDLTNDRQASGSNETFRVYDGLVIPDGTYYKNGGSWNTKSGDQTVPFTNATTDDVSNDQSIAIRYYPATYYVAKTSGTYSLNGSSGDCATPNAAHYLTFRDNPGSLSSDVDSLGPDGGCLTKIEIKSGTNSYSNDGSRTECPNSCTYNQEIDNFANWYSYFRKRHLALRAGMGQAFDGLKAMRTGIFTINNRSNVTMWDLDVASAQTAFFDKLYNIDGNSGGTPNRQALGYAGEQYKRTNSGAPIIEECQKNFTLLFTDGYSTLTNPSPSAGGADNNKGVPYADSINDTIADVAMKYYDTQLLSGTFTAGQVKTPAGCKVAPTDPSLDCNKNLHMNTFTVGLGAKGTIFGVTHNEVADAYTTPPTWPNVNSARDPRQVDDLYHAAVNGRGQMLNADSASDLQAKLKQAVLGINAQVGVASAVTFNTATLETNSAVYLAFFNSGNWSGDLVAFDLDGQGEVDLLYSWSAGEVLDTPNPAFGSRMVITYDDTAGSETGIPFRWADLNANQQADLNAAPGGIGADVVGFIRGDRSNEGAGKFRVRTSALGDIINGSPIFVGIPSLRWPSSNPFPDTASTSYHHFRSGLVTTPRTEMVYYGGNDGMLHGVEASSGVEKLAYIPAYLYNSSATEGLHFLAEPAYQHRYYVDLPPTVSDVYINTGGGDEWHTILIGGSRAGGKGLFALDITNPANFTEANAAAIALWEFTHPDLGYTYSKPTVAMMENGKWAAIFGNGYNDTGTGQAALFILFIEEGLDGWAATDYKIIYTPAGTVSPNGLATPAVLDTDGNGAADRVYAGDLEGRLWGFDLSDTADVTNWKIAHELTSGQPEDRGPKPLFIATDAFGNSQPITNKPSVVFHPDSPSGNHAPDLIVMFGTGKYLESSDLTDTSAQTFYGVWDEDGTNELGRSDLEPQTLVAGSFANSDGDALRVLTDNTVDYSSKHGWLFDLPAVGERVVVDSHIRGSLIFFNTWIPSSEPCDAGGTGFLMSVEHLNGGAPDDPAFNIDGIDADGESDVDDDDIVNDGTDDHNPAGQEYDNGLPASSAFLSNKQYTPGTGSNLIEVREVQDLGDSLSGRLSWQQLIAE